MLYGDTGLEFLLFFDAYTIHLELTGLVEEKVPSSASVYVEDVSFIAYYQDGTNAVYNIEGTGEDIVAVNCPGYLTLYSIEVNPGRQPDFYVYTYTEAGVTTQPFFLYSEWYE